MVERPAKILVVDDVPENVAEVAPSPLSAEAATAPHSLTFRSRRHPFPRLRGRRASVRQRAGQRIPSRGVPASVDPARAAVAESFFRPAVQGLVPYEPGKPAEEVQRELGLARCVKLASNEGPFGPLPAALEALAAASPT